jgi:O-succinylbenzoic acid--CoA ligase
VVVVGVPDAEWGQQLVGVVTGVIPGDDQLAIALAQLPRHYRPRRWVHIDALPVRGPGKPDRAAAARIAASAREG